MVRPRLIWFVLGMICLATILLSTSSRSLLATESTYPIRITPDRMEITGDVTTRSNCQHPTVCSWLENTPEGTIMLGVDPASPNP
ncbi:MAG: hypothetical protein N0A03_07540, partial [Anaerolineae bacterium]|nr:hypothetical protein [Anaerolineae bacterium]